LLVDCKGVLELVGRMIDRKRYISVTKDKVADVKARLQRCPVSFPSHAKASDIEGVWLLSSRSGLTRGEQKSQDGKPGPFLTGSDNTFGC
jgi:hypothetical protein